MKLSQFQGAWALDTDPQVAVVVSAQPAPQFSFRRLACRVGAFAGGYFGWKRSPNHPVWGALGFGILGGAVADFLAGAIDQS